MKLESGFGLDNANWPACVVDDSAIVRHANPSAVQLLGTVMEGGPALSASIWTLENEIAPEEFLTKSERSSVPMSLLQFRVKGGGTARFQTYVCSLVREGHSFFVLQRLRAPAAPGPAPPPASGPAATGQTAFFR